MFDALTTRKNGFTVLELLIAMVTGLVVLSAMISTFSIQRKYFDVMEQSSEMAQNVRAAIDIMSREIRMAGYLVTDSGKNPCVIDTANTAKITIIGDVDSDIGIKLTDVTDANTYIEVESPKGKTITKDSRFPDYIYLSDGGDADFIAIDQTQPKPVVKHHGKYRILLSRSPGRSYGVGSAVKTVETVIFDLVGSTIRRNSQPIADNIGKLKFTKNGNTVDIELTAETSKVNSDFGGAGSRTRTIKTRVQLRNG